jgi:heme/copper-type cytochrome/quinol oxidase subunit 2
VRLPPRAVPLVVAAAAVGCAAEAPDTSGVPTRTVPSAPATASERRVEVAFAGGRVSPEPGRVRVTVGEQVRLVVTSDVTDEIHVHGYDLEARIGPGAPGELAFTADQPGLFEVETHETEKLLCQLLVQ